MATASKSAPSKTPTGSKPFGAKKPAAAAARTAAAAKPKADAATKAEPVTPVKQTVVTKPAVTETKLPVQNESAVAGLLLEAGAAPLESIQEMVRQFAESGLGQSQSVFDGFRDAADSATMSFEESTAATRNAVSKMNGIISESVMSGPAALFDTIKALADADSPTDFVTIWNEQSQKQFETMVKNNQQLTVAMRSCAEEAAKPFLAGYSHSFNG